MQGIYTLWDILRAETHLYYLLQTILLEDNFKRKFYMKLLLLGYEFFGPPRPFYQVLP